VKARAECESQRLETKQLCDREIEAAQTKAARIIQDALERAQNIRSRARVQLVDAINTLAA
jgi:F0F1-type ATP synthase membrane subunit b/b'